MAPNDHFKKLESHLLAGDYDKAADLVCSDGFREYLRSVDKATTRGIRLACMACDCYDYADMKADAKGIIGQLGQTAYQHIGELNGETARLSSIYTPDDLAFFKEQCWACLHAGMCEYRLQTSKGYQDAREKFEAAKELLERLHEEGHSSLGSLSRAWYCLALVGRQEHRIAEARHAFAESARLGWEGMEARQKGQLATGSFEHGIGKNLGLGAAFVAYVDGSVWQAQCDIVGARRFLGKGRAKFIEAYVEIVHAAIMASGRSDRATIDSSIGCLKHALSQLAPEVGIQHRAYALRAKNELAYAFLRKAKLTTEAVHENLYEAEAVLAEALKLEGKRDARTASFAWVIKCRIHLHRSRVSQAGLDRAELSEAETAANKAKELAGDSTFNQIDCYIALGEVSYEQLDQPSAIKHFKLARQLGNDNPKIRGACDLHIARTLIAQGKNTQAGNLFADWEVTKDGGENCFVKGLADEVGGRLVAGDDRFVFSQNGMKRNAKDQVVAFRQWLAKRAMARFEDRLTKRQQRSDAADWLGIKVGALNLWLEAKKS